MRSLPPHLVLELAPAATDEDVDARYHALVKRYPPDEAPEEFEVVQAAYQALRTRRDRVAARLLWNPTSDGLSDLAWWLARAPRRRHDLDALRAMVAESLDD